MFREVGNLQSKGAKEIGKKDSGKAKNELEAEPINASLASNA